MAIFTVVTDTIDDADAIALGDKAFQSVAANFGANIGDFVHYHYVKQGRALPHSVSDKLYIITHIEEVDDTLSIIGFQPAMSWRGYVHRTLRSAKDNNDTCSISFFGSGKYGHYRVKDYNDCGVTLVDDSRAEMHREFECISDIQFSHCGVIL